jgi:dihydroorotate dehydrogenase (NAD+) catalytic subunit
MAIDAFRMRPVLGNISGGLSGPAIKPLALKAVWDVYGAVKIPIIGVGGIMTGIDAAEFMLAGASCVQVGTMNFVDPASTERVLEELKEYLKKQKIDDVKSLIGKAHDKTR